ncbi:MAG: hypothetical protein WB239_13915 [Acidimicrobiia bacterium]
MIQFYRTHEAPWKTLVMAFFNPERQLVADVDPSPQSPVPPRATIIRENFVERVGHVRERRPW